MAGNAKPVTHSTSRAIDNTTSPMTASAMTSMPAPEERDRPEKAVATADMI